LSFEGNRPSSKRVIEIKPGTLFVNRLQYTSVLSATGRIKFNDVARIKLRIIIATLF
jgi:hypothetical protein